MPVERVREGGLEEGKEMNSERGNGWGIEGGREGIEKVVRKEGEKG